MEYIYINAGSSVAIEKSEDGKQVEKIFIDGKQHKFEDEEEQVPKIS
mgnify:CR=1 FL=1